VWKLGDVSWMHPVMKTAQSCWGFGETTILWLNGTCNAAPNALQVRETVVPLAVLQNQ